MRDEFLKSCLQTLFKVSVKECYFVGAGLQQLADNELQHILSKLDNVVKFHESYLRLDVPEFSKVLRSVGVLGTE